MDTKPRYSVGTWDSERQAYTPQVGVQRSININMRTLRKVLKQLRAMGYSAHRKRDPIELPIDKGHINHEDNDFSVLVERTDGMTRKQILESWQR